MKPCEERQAFDQFIDFVVQQEKRGETNGEVRYAQTRESSRSLAVTRAGLFLFEVGFPVIGTTRK